MTFEELEETIWRRGYGIVACNHYTIEGQRRTYCVVLSRDNARAFKAEGHSSDAVFGEIVRQIDAYGQETD